MVLVHIVCRFNVKRSRRPCVDFSLWFVIISINRRDDTVIDTNAYCQNYIIQFLHFRYLLKNINISKPANVAFACRDKYIQMGNFVCLLLWHSFLAPL